MALSLIRRPFTYRYYNVTTALIAVNVLVFLLNYLSPSSRILLALVPQLVVDNHAYWEFVTYMFVHANITHILFNMLGLFFFGYQVEHRMGSTEFLVFYLTCGVGAGIASFVIYILTGAFAVVLLGASGAVFAVLLAYATFFPTSMIYVFGIIPVRAPILVVIYALIELFSQIFSWTGGVAHLTHLAGFAFAYLYLAGRIGVSPIRAFLSSRTSR